MSDSVPSVDTPAAAAFWSASARIREYDAFETTTWRWLAAAPHTTTAAGRRATEPSHASASGPERGSTTNDRTRVSRPGFNAASILTPRIAVGASSIPTRDTGLTS